MIIMVIVGAEAIKNWSCRRRIQPRTKAQSATMQFPTQSWSFVASISNTQRGKTSKTKPDTLNLFASYPK